MEPPSCHPCVSSNGGHTEVVGVSFGDLGGGDDHEHAREQPCHCSRPQSLHPSLEDGLESRDVPRQRTVPKHGWGPIDDVLLS